jgi:hypothetical protein
MGHRHDLKCTSRDGQTAQQHNPMKREESPWL